MYRETEQIQKKIQIYILEIEYKLCFPLNYHVPEMAVYFEPFRKDLCSFQVYV